MGAPHENGRAILATSVLLCSVWTLAACTSWDRTLLDTDPLTGTSPFHTMVTFNYRGDPIQADRDQLCESLDCRARSKYLDRYTIQSDEDYDQHLTDVFAARSLYRAQTGNRRVLLFVHGGLTSLDASIRRALALLRVIRTDGEDAAFPISINWQTALDSSYVDYAFNIRRGQDWSPWGWPLAPLYLVADMSRAVGSAPLTWWNMYQNDVATLRAIPWSEAKTLAELRPTLEDLFHVQYGGPCPPEVSNGSHDCRTGWELFRSGLSWAVTQPTKLVSAPVVDAVGTSAWQAMRRVSHLLFHSERDFCVGWDCAGLAKNHHTDTERTEGIGGLSEFLRRLRREVTAAPNDWEIMLVGHSMGAIVIDEILRRFPDLPVRRIVFMGAATSVRDYEDSVFPYLQAHPETEMHHLVLHEQAELRDRVWEWFVVAPRGSLLTWIDSFFTRPETRLDRTVGRWANLALAMHNTPDAIPAAGGATGPSSVQSSLERPTQSPRQRVYVKVFRVDHALRCTDPQKHGDFADFPFWRRAFWGVNQPESVRRLDGCD